jgi:DNA-binding LacI/PurR family transcriptional regulator
VKSAGIEPVELLVEHENELTPERLSPFLFGPKRVEAIFTLNWVCTMRVMRALNAAKKKILTDFPLISFDDFELAELIPPGLTVVRQPVHELGHQAAKALFERMAGTGKQPPRKIILSTEFIVRGSCGCKPEDKG